MTSLLKRRLIKKCVKRKRQAVGVHAVVAVALSKKGNVLGISCNNLSHVPGMRHFHAEGILMARYGKAIQKIIIVRADRRGNILPIEPCEQCCKLALRLGITIESIGEEE